MKLFEFAVIYQGKKNKDGEYTKKAAIITEPKCVLAVDEKQAAMMAAREIPSDYAEDLDKVEVIVRPF